MPLDGPWFPPPRRVGWPSRPERVGASSLRRNRVRFRPSERPQLTERLRPRGTGRRGRAPAEWEWYERGGTSMRAVRFVVLRVLGAGVVGAGPHSRRAGWRWWWGTARTRQSGRCRTRATTRRTWPRRWTGWGSTRRRSGMPYLEQPLEIGILFREVRGRVLEETGGEQRPHEYASLLGEHYLRSTSGPGTVTVAARRVDRHRGATGDRVLASPSPRARIRRTSKRTWSSSRLASSRDSHATGCGHWVQKPAIHRSEFGRAPRSPTSRAPRLARSSGIVRRAPKC